MNPKLDFDRHWHSGCGKPRVHFDRSFHYSCDCADQPVKKSKLVHWPNRADVPLRTPIISESIFGERFGFINDVAPLGFNTRFCAHEFVWGIASVCLKENVDEIAGYVFLYETDQGITEAYKHRLEAEALAKHISTETGSCILVRSLKGWHFTSLNLIPFHIFQNLAMYCQTVMPSDHQFLVLRISTKANERNGMQRFQHLYTAPSPYPISVRHKALWQLALKAELPTTQPEVLCRIMRVNYPAWS